MGVTKRICEGREPSWMGKPGSRCRCTARYISNADGKRYCWKHGPAARGERRLP